MNPPGLTAYRLLLACLTGCVAGIWYGFLRPLRPRWLGDLLFVPGLFWCWLVLGFKICDGDLRLGYTAALLLCIFLWDRTAGKLLTPLFFGFWRLFRRVSAHILHPFRIILKKILKICKKIFAMQKKWVTIKWSWYSHKKGGEPHV